MRTFLGDAKREKPVYEAGPLGPWHATVKVVPLRLGDRVEFEVYAAWTGPPQPGFAPDPRPGERSDSFQVSDLELARGIALRAEELLRAGALSQHPIEREAGYVALDLRAIHRKLQARLGRTGELTTRGARVLDPMTRGPKPPKS